jgi:oligopeptide transport system substrate-binding protein
MGDGLESDSLGLMPRCFALSILLAVLLGPASLLPSALAKEESGAAGTNILVKGNSTEPESLDPQIVRGAAEWTIAAALFEGLVVADPATLAPAPGVAESWTVSPDGLVYRFNLRPDARWSDGTPLTAEDFVYSARRLLSPGLGSTHVENTLIFLRNADAYVEGREKDFSKVGVRSPEPGVLEFELAQPAPFFLSALMQFYPVKQDVIEKFGRFDQRGTAWIRPGNLVSNGPFLLEAWVPNKEVLVRKNPHYWDAGQVGLDGVQFLPIENSATEEAAFRNGQLHLTASVPVANIPFYEQKHPEWLQKIEDFGIYFYSVNVARPPMDDPRVRRALSLALDRESLVKYVLRGGRKAAWSFSPPGMPGYEPPMELRYDPEAARQLLAEAGFPGGKGMRPVEILVDGRPPHRLVAEVVQEMWRKNLGIEVAISSQETRVLIATKNAKKFDLARGSWNATTYQDPQYFMAAWTTGNLFNEAGWSNADFDRAIAAAQAEADPQKRAGLFVEAEKIFLQNLPAIPIFYTTQVLLKQPAVAGWTGAPYNDRRFKQLSLGLEPSSR